MLIESITLAQRDNKELEALIYRFRPLIRKCGRQLHIEDGEQEMENRRWWLLSLN